MLEEKEKRETDGDDGNDCNHLDLKIEEDEKKLP